MKKIFIYILTLNLFTGCSGFLDEVDKDQLIPTKTEHFSSVLLNEFSKEVARFGAVDYMADNIVEYIYSSENTRRPYKPIYSWQKEIELDENGVRATNNNKAWEDMYKDVGIANYVIELVEEAEGAQSERDFIKGEAYFVRAWSFFNLTNLYAKPYSKENANVELGIPLRIDNGLEQTYDRATLKESYEQIIADLQMAQDFLMKSGITKTKYHPTVDACNLLFSRIYLYMNDWENADAYASKVIANNPLSMMVESGPYVTEDRTDILYSSGLLAPSISESAFDAGWQVNPAFIRLFDKTNDLRFNAFFTRMDKKIGEVYYTQKQGLFTKLGFVNLRVAEAYLNRAEARYHLGGDAMADLNALVAKRYRAPSAVQIPASGPSLLDFILLERRKELCFEDHHRWFDLRRMKNRPAIEHRYTLTDDAGNKVGTEKYVLLSNDPNYTLPIPLKERDNNPLIRNNERYEKLPETTIDDNI
ncbi:MULTISPECIES: RagB/SusD family nutrient uptake outer membrane protein [Sphingobacterium]|uniref:RagB/SusD family nutrient uptake outer membrane protein n=1 Tax=Sphingobacterium TaxID=28453 RepID=UPI0013D9E94F|nr:MULTISPECIES: RagB/SusD family nutrient uptake outer membrane protein [unclassified Sphingobacterium]